MNLHGIVSVSGKPGLWKALAQNKAGFILESLDAQRIKLVVNVSTAKLAALDEITIFGADGDLRLKDVLENMKTTSEEIPDPKADGKKLRLFFREVGPDHDEEKVYSSDIKKIINWFNILKELPLFNEEPATAAAGIAQTEKLTEVKIEEIEEPMKADAVPEAKVAESSVNIVEPQDTPSDSEPLQTEEKTQNKSKKKKTS